MTNQELQLTQLRNNDILRNKGIFMVPYLVYQQFLTSAAVHDTQVAKLYIRGKLLQYIADKYPGKALNNFAEVKGKDGKYQMWIQLLNDGETTFDGTIGIEDSLKQLNYE